MQFTDLNIGVLFVLAISSLGVYGIVLAGWASNSKYPLLGGLRSSAQMISYELPLGLAVAAPLLMSNTLSLREIVDSQSALLLGLAPRWNVFRGPLPQVISFIMFLIAAFAETNRVPFDLPEAENELVAGFHTEYSSMKFAGFFMAEYANMITVCSMATVLFLGGWLPLWPASMGSGYCALGDLRGGGPDRAVPRAASCAQAGPPHPAGVRGRVLRAGGAVPGSGARAVPRFRSSGSGAKAGMLLFVFIWVRGTLPRFRYDQLMRFAWSFLFPVAMVNLMATGLLVALFG